MQRTLSPFERCESFARRRQIHSDFVALRDGVAACGSSSFKPTLAGGEFGFPIFDFVVAWKPGEFRLGTQNDLQVIFAKFNAAVREGEPFLCSFNAPFEVSDVLGRSLRLRPDRRVLLGTPTFSLVTIATLKHLGRECVQVGDFLTHRGALVPCRGLQRILSVEF